MSNPKRPQHARPTRRNVRRRGVSLLEALLATALLTFTVTAMSEALAASFRAEQVARDQSAAYATASEMLELVAARPAEEPEEDDSSPGGNGLGPGGNGLGPGGNGLGAATAADAAGGPDADASGGPGGATMAAASRARLMATSSVGNKIGAMRQAREMARTVPSLSDLAQNPVDGTLNVSTADGEMQEMAVTMTATPHVVGSYLVEVQVAPPGRPAVKVSRLVFEGGR